MEILTEKCDFSQLREFCQAPEFHCDESVLVAAVKAAHNKVCECKAVVEKVQDMEGGIIHLHQLYL